MRAHRETVSQRAAAEWSIRAVAALWCMMGACAPAAADTPAPFSDHVHGVWRGSQSCPNARAAEDITLSIVNLDTPGHYGGIFHSEAGVRRGDGPLRVTADEKARTLHIDLREIRGARIVGFDFQMDASGDQLTRINYSGPCSPLVMARTVDANAAGSGMPVITGVSEVVASGHQRIVISGHGFGFHAPIQGNSVVFAITDHSAASQWDAGFAGDVPPNILTAFIPKWQDDEIDFAGFFTGYDRFMHLNPGDKLTFYVWNPGTLAGPASFDVAVADYPPEADTASVAPGCKNRAIAPEARIAACSALIEQQPGAAVLYRLRGVAYLKAGKLDAAMADFDKALAIDPKMAAALADKGLALSARKDFTAAIEQGFTPALALDARQPDVLSQRALAYYRSGDRERALADANAAGNHFEALLLKAELLLEAGRYTDAGDALRQADYIDSGDWRVTYLGGLAFVGSGNREQAQKALRIACEQHAPKEMDACGKADALERQQRGFDVFSIVRGSRNAVDVAGALAELHRQEGWQ